MGERIAMKHNLLILLGLLCVAQAGFADDANGPAGATALPSNAFSADDLAFFEKRIRPLLAEHCFRCHSTRAKRTRGGLALDSRAAILKGGDTGPAFVPGHPDKSLLIRAIGYKDGDLQMPPSGKLAESQMLLLEQWIRRGAPFPGEAVAKLNKPAGIDIDAGRQFWSFRPFQKIETPAVALKTWPRQRIDHFVLAELEKRQLSPSVQASKRDLIRRAYFDLTGLPPTPEETQAFINDADPQAYAKVVEQLLRSPHYGERWARHWLDLTRYCDIGESWANDRGDPHLYRDWVVQAINDDLPYDQFVMKQLAADLQPQAPASDLAALGFIGLSPSYWKELKLDQNVIRTVVAEEWEERIHAVTSTFLGLTVACARCHDHKFDPISTQDYYALAGIFASTRPMERPMLPAGQAEKVLKARKQVEAWRAQLTALKNKKGDAKDIKSLEGKIAELKKATPHFNVGMAPAVVEASLYVLPDGKHRTRLEWRPQQARDVAVQIRGSPSNLGPVVPRRFIEVLSASPDKFTQGSGRLELARAIVSDSAPLAARVFVNRVWRHHFGTGLVETPSDFGAQGERPANPQLLDDLARRFIDNNWSLRWLHREIMLSATYQQTSRSHQPVTTAPKYRIKSGIKLPDPEDLDPGNRYYWRMNRRRLDVEAWRDAMLQVTGLLDRKLGGPALDLGDANNHRRTIYGRVKRRELDAMLRLHDFPDPTTHHANRVPTTTPLQQLFVLNSPFLQQQSAALAQRLAREFPDSDAERIRRAYQLLYGRAPTANQVKLAQSFLSTTPTPALWQQYAHVLLSSNEFLFVD